MGEEGADRLVGGAEGDTFFGHGVAGPDGDADRFIITGGRNWIMDFSPGADWLSVRGISTDAQLLANATQVGDHLHIGFYGGDLYLAWTTLAELEGWPVALTFADLDGQM